MKKIQIAFLFLLIFFTCTSVASAKSFTIDDVHIKAWIQSDGDLIVNEIFTYSFDGEYKRVSRSIHQANHDGVIDFKAYELLDPHATVGFVDQKDLRSLEVSREDNTYYSAIPSKNESRKIFYYYELDNAVKSYDTYSDLTVPFFGTGSNHDTDLQNVKIDILLPQSIDSEKIYAFFHTQNGTIEKNSIGARYLTPVSSMYTLTEARLLFPSNMMTGQEKKPETLSLKETIADEEKTEQIMAKNAEKREGLQSLMKVVIPILIIGCVVLLLLLPQRRLWRFPYVEEHFQTDPLYLYILHRRGKLDHYSILAGLYSLVEKGFADVKLTQVSMRFQNDLEAPDQTLSFTLTTPIHHLSKTEQFLVKWLFKRKGKKGLPSFVMYDIAGATKREKTNKQHLNKYHRNVSLLKKQEKEWFSSVMAELKENQIVGDTLIRIITPVLVCSIFVSVIYAYQIDFMTHTNSFLYIMIAGASLLASLIKPKSRWVVFTFMFISFYSSLMLHDENLLRWQSYFIMAATLLYALTPTLTLSSEADLVNRATKSFRKKISIEGIPQDLSDGELEKWVLRSLLFKLRQPITELNSIRRIETELASVAPLTYLALSNEEPIGYLINTWKWSTPPSSSTSSSGGDGGSYSSSDSGSSGDGGGGGGGD